MKLSSVSKSIFMGSLLAVLATAFIMRPSPPVGLVSAVIFDTHEYPADGDVRTLTWTNTTGHPLMIRKSYLWVGMYRGGIADVDAQVTLADGSIVAKLQWDHYADPTAPVYKDDYFDPGMTLAPGEALTLTYFCRAITPQPTVAAAQFIMWWTQ